MLPLMLSNKIHIYGRDNTHMTFIKIIQFSRPPTPLVHQCTKFFHPLDLGRPISNEPLHTVNGFTVWIQSLGFLSNNILIAWLVMAQIQCPFIKKNEDWTSRTLSNLTPPTSNNISFYLNPPLLPKWTSYVYHPQILNHDCIFMHKKLTITMPASIWVSYDF